MRQRTDSLVYYSGIAAVISALLVIAVVAYNHIGFETQLANTSADRVEKQIEEVTAGDYGIAAEGKVSELAIALTTPAYRLKQHLLIYGVSEEEADIWSQIPQSPPKTKDGRFIARIPFYMAEKLPMLGIRCQIIPKPNTDSSIIILIDTVFDLRKD